MTDIPEVPPELIEAFNNGPVIITEHQPRSIGDQMVAMYFLQKRVERRFVIIRECTRGEYLGQWLMKKMNWHDEIGLKYFYEVMAD
jgi:hypothetical protein